MHDMSKRADMPRPTFSYGKSSTLWCKSPSHHLNMTKIWDPLDPVLKTICLAKIDAFRCRIKLARPIFDNFKTGGVLILPNRQFGHIPYMAIGK